jgi:hypothetical protein
MVKKEHGTTKFLDYLSASIGDPEKALTNLGIGNYAELDSLLLNYLVGLIKDIQQQKMPNSYLTW